MLTTAGYKYYLMDDINNECRIYNTDFNLWKIIPLNIPPGEFLYDVRNVSDNLFDGDASIELVYISYKYDTLFYYYTYHLKLINEDGSVILEVPGGYFSDVLSTGESEQQLFIYSGDFSIWPYQRETHIYALPGQLFIPQPEPGSMSSLPPYPNPVARLINIPYSLPSGDRTGGWIEITDQNGRQVRSIQVQDQSGNCQVDVTHFAPGVYYYQIRIREMVIPGQRFIVGGSR